DELGKQLAQLLDVRGTRAQDLGRGRIVQQREQQMLHGDEFVALLPGIHEGHVQADFELLRDHTIPLTSARKFVLYGATRLKSLPSRTATDARACARTRSPAPLWSLRYLSGTRRTRPSLPCALSA